MVLLHNVVLLCVIWGCVGQWSYSGEDGPDFWSDLSTSWAGWNIDNECGGFNQSPIDIDTLVTEVDTSMDAFVITNYNQQDLGLENLEAHNHLSVSIPRIEASDTLAKLSGGGLTGDYELRDIYFHWGSVDTQGSEHRIDGRAYPMEVQFMHSQPEYFDDWYAYYSGETDAVAGLAVLFEISDEDNPTIGSVMTALIGGWQDGGDTSYFIDAFNLDLLVPTNMSDFYRYTGSKTFPCCEETVVWTVFKETIPISSAQMEIIRTSVRNWIIDDSIVHVADNFRPPMPLNGRTVKSVITTTPRPTTTAPPTTEQAVLPDAEDSTTSRPTTDGATLQHASLCVILVALVAVCQLF